MYGEGETYGSFTQYSDGAIWEPHYHRHPLPGADRVYIYGGEGEGGVITATP